MTMVYISDTSVFVRCGGPYKEKVQRLRRAFRQADISLQILQRVYEERGGDPAADEYPSGNIPYPDGFEEGWIAVADDLDYTNPLVVRQRSLLGASIINHHGFWSNRDSDDRTRTIHPCNCEN
ncbi:hypothetical protein [Haladaptatus halobius]|uniref:hypothetical protein n=1 Tax=Haladaptatus halobius TaxID=2884875 RepID=UPI001D0AFA5C|nr:hypothetical protein [Haladaptatus halobius]